jgi:hypothetical protein
MQGENGDATPVFRGCYVNILLTTYPPVDALLKEKERNEQLSHDVLSLLVVTQHFL